MRSRLEFHCGRQESINVLHLCLVQEDSDLTHFINHNQPTYEELIVLLLALIPHIQPHFLSSIIASIRPEGGELPELGGIRGTNHRGLLPTGETALFLLAGESTIGRIEVQHMFTSEHWFAKKQILWLEPVREGEPVMSGRLILDSEVIEQLTTGIISKPRFSTDFPAEHVETEMEWDDLVLHPNTLRQIREIENWIMYTDTYLKEWGMKKKIKPGYRALFYGPPGTGKTLTATLLGKYTGKDVFRIDLSRVVSKYIGETEKNLSKLFDKAEHKNWILFFDEADALFGKRTSIRDAHDKYANQEVAYLLQRVEGYDGLVILATNQRNNIDEAFTRRFHSIIHFPMPRPEERFEIWSKAFPPQIEISDDIDWKLLSSRYELTGSSIMSIAHFSAITALADNSKQIDLKRIEAAVLREYVKDGKIV
ncbi:MAG TPA: ATP-binding protein [Saprospiraceae bacterium]|nr:ATP-binding protein [Saprospiraceae bacterium]